MLPHIIRFALVPCLLLLVSGCAPWGQEAGQLAEARKAWGTTHTHYTYEFFWRCFCPQEHTQRVKVTVQSGQVVDVVPVDTAAAAITNFSSWRTVEGLFDLIDEAIKRPADVVTVQFDETTGFPLSFDADYVKEGFDEEMGFRASALADIP